MTTPAEPIGHDTSGSRTLIALVVSDSETRSEARGILEEAGHHVVELTSAEAGLQGDGGEATLYLVDLDLPEGAGVDVVRRLQSHDPDLPVVVGVSQDQLTRATEALHAGGYDFVTKPWDKELLLHAVRRAVEHRELVNCVRRLSGHEHEEEAPVSSSRVIPLRDLERHAIENALKATNGSVGKAAKLLGIGRATLYRRLAALELERRSAS